MAEIKEPICKTALPSAPAPRIPCMINFSEDEQDQQIVPPSAPIATRTRSKKTPAITLISPVVPPAATISALAAISPIIFAVTPVATTSAAVPHYIPAAHPTLDLNATVMPSSSPSEEEEDSLDSTLYNAQPASQTEDLSRSRDSPNLSRD